MGVSKSSKTITLPIELIMQTDRFASARAIKFNLVIERALKAFITADLVEAKPTADLVKEFDDVSVRRIAIQAELEDRKTSTSKAAEELAQKELEKAKQLQVQAKENARVKKYEAWWSSLDDDEKTALLDAGFNQAKEEGLKGSVAARRKSNLIDEWWCGGKWEEVIATAKKK